MTLKEFETFPNLALSEKQQLPDCSAVYFVVAQDRVLYVGLATNLRNRWRNHHRFPQLEAISERGEVKIFWLTCPQYQLPELERRYIAHYSPVLNQSKVPTRRFIPSADILSLSLKKLSNRLIGLGTYVANDSRLETIVLRYLAANSETRLATTTVRKSLQSVNKRPDSLLKWTETVRRKDGAHWKTRCNGIEVRLVPWFGERIMHNPSMYKIMREKRFSAADSIPMSDCKAMRQTVKLMPLKERLSLAKSSPRGRELFPLECGARFCSVADVDILCLTEQQLQALLAGSPTLHTHYPAIGAIDGVVQTRVTLLGRHQSFKVQLEQLLKDFSLTQSVTLAKPRLNHARIGWRRRKRFDSYLGDRSGLLTANRQPTRFPWKAGRSQ